MEEKDDDKKAPTLPHGYEYIADYTNKAQQDLRDIDAKIEALPKDRIDTDAPKPFGTVRQTEAGKYKSELSRFEQQREEVKTKLNDDIGRETKHVDPKDAAAIKEYSDHAVKDGVYNKQAKNTEAFEKKQDDFAKQSDDAKANKNADNKARENNPSRSERLFSNTNYNVQTNQLNVTNVNVSKDNVSFNGPEDAQPQQSSRKDAAFSKSSFAKEQGEAEKSKEVDKGKGPEAEKSTDEKGIDAGNDAKPKRSDAVFANSGFSQEQSTSDKKSDFAANKSDVTAPSDPGGSAGGSSPSKDDK